LPPTNAAPPAPRTPASQGGGVIGWRGGEPVEVEGSPALGLVLAALPGVALRAFHVAPGSLPDADAPPGAWHELVGVEPARGTGQSFVVLGDPTMGQITDLLAGLDFA
jgi:small ligand-binding sensory domain FIST